jgi:hypothetical protein
LDARVPDITVCIGTEASQQEQAELLTFLDKNSDVFAWSISDLVGVNRDIIEHRLHVSLTAGSKKKKLHKMFKEKWKLRRLRSKDCWTWVSSERWSTLSG